MSTQPIVRHLKGPRDVTEKVRALGQFFTPYWAASALVNRWFPDLGRSDVVVEATCGPGPFLKAIPSEVLAIGVEIDPELAEIARRNTGRRVITGDFTQVDLEVRPTAIVGNPPFAMSDIDRLLDRCHQVLPEHGRVGWILPCYALQTPSRVVRYSESWSLATELLPRTLFPGLQCPLLFAQFTKDRRRILSGLALYFETHDIASMPAQVAETLKGRPDGWKAIVGQALQALGGRGSLEAIYEKVQPRRPTGNPFWKEQVRKVLRSHFEWVGDAQYALAAAA